MPNDKVIVLNSRLLKSWKTVSVAGFVKEPKDFEWQEGINAIDLIVLCGGYLPDASKNEIVIERIIPGELATKSIRLPLKNGLFVDNNKDFILKPGDRVVVNIEDSYYEQEVIVLAGALKNPGSYSLAFRGETFKNFMERVALIDSVAYVKGGRLFRKQTDYDLFKSRTNLSQSANPNMNPNMNPNLNPYMNPNMSSNMNPNMNPLINPNMNQNMSQNNLSQNLIGTKIIASDQKNYRINFDFEKVLQGKEKDIVLQGGDSIFIPFDTPTVNVNGEVVGPGHVLWQNNWKAKDYINAAGGVTITGDADRIIITYANGQKTTASQAKRNPDPGSEIYVPFKPLPEPTKMTEWVTVIGGLVTAIATVTTLVITVIKL